MQLIALIVAIGWALCPAFSATGIRGKEPVHTFIQSENNLPGSFDPLNADKSDNIRVMRMLYATPLEAADDGKLYSRILEKFRYDKASRTARFTLKKGLRFSDGNPITIKDLTLAFARMAFSKPKFPVIRNIAGVHTWSEAGSLRTLPQGISVDDQTVVIKFDKDTNHPLFRFVLEIFAVQPVSAFDLDQNKLKVDIPPFSGPYSLVSKSDSSLMFKVRPEALSGGEKIPEEIKFIYLTPDELVRAAPEFDGKTVALAKEASFDSTDLKKLQNPATIYSTPASWFSMFLFNSEWKTFKSQKCRQIMASELRKTASQLASNPFPVEGSIFTKIMPGYMPLDELAGEFSVSDLDQRSCLEQLKETSADWANCFTTNDENANRILLQTLKRLKIIDQSFTPKKLEARDRSKLFLENKIPALASGSGFWALDPAGDIQMLFAPDFHALIQQVAKDDKLQSLLSHFGNTDNQNEVGKLINRHLFKDAKVNVYVHTSRFFITSKSQTLSKLSTSLVLPSPWQVFDMD